MISQYLALLSILENLDIVLILYSIFGEISLYGEGRLCLKPQKFLQGH